MNEVHRRAELFDFVVVLHAEYFDLLIEGELAAAGDHGGGHGVRLQVVLRGDDVATVEGAGGRGVDLRRGVAGEGLDALSRADAHFEGTTGRQRKGQQAREQQGETRHGGVLWFRVLPPCVQRPDQLSYPREQGEIRPRPASS